MSSGLSSTRLSRRSLGKLGASAAAASTLAVSGVPWEARAVAQDEPTPTPDVATSGEGETEISFLSVVGTSSPAGQGRLRVIERFVEANPGVTVNYEAIPYDQFFSQLVTRALAGDAPQIAQDGYHTAQFAVNNLLVQLDDYIERDGVVRDDYWPALWQLGEFQGGTWAFPFTIDTRFTYSNPAIYEQLGVAVPDTWDQMFEVGAAAKDAGLTAGFGASMGSEIGGFWETASHFGHTNNAAFLRVNEDGTATSTMSTPEVAETVEFLSRLVNEGIVPNGSLALSGSELNSLFTTNQIGSVFTGNWMIAGFDQVLEEGDMDFTPELTHLPMNVQRGASAGGWAWYAFNTLSDPDVGWQFINFFNQEESVNEGWPDSLPPSMTHLQVPRYADDPRNEFVSEVLSYSSWPIPPVTGHMELMPPMWRAVAMVINGQASVEDALRDGDEQVQRLLDSGHNTIVGG